MPPGRARALGQAAALGPLIESGMTMTDAAVMLGVSRRTVYRLWGVLVSVTPKPSLATRAR